MSAALGSNRLTSANGAYGAFGYSYDLSGNRIAHTRPGVNAGYMIALGSNPPSLKLRRTSR